MDIGIIASRVISEVGRRRLCRELGIREPSTYKWEWPGRGIPPRRVLDIERISGISRHELRPDIFGPPPRSGPDA